VFVSGRPFQPEAPFRCSTLGWVPGLTHMKCFITWSSGLNIIIAKRKKKNNLIELIIYFLTIKAYLFASLKLNF
jgi:hypothetical protein